MEKIIIISALGIGVYYFFFKDKKIKNKLKKAAEEKTPISTATKPVSEPTTQTNSSFLRDSWNAESDENDEKTETVHAVNNVMDTEESQDVFDAILNDLRNGATIHFWEKDSENNGRLSDFIFESYGQEDPYVINEQNFEGVTAFLLQHGTDFLDSMSVYKDGEEVASIDW